MITLQQKTYKIHVIFKPHPLHDRPLTLIMEEEMTPNIHQHKDAKITSKEL